MPPTQRPLRLEAAILSRMRSPVTSRSNCANDSSTFSVSRPIEVVVLNCWVTATNETPLASKTSTILAKSARERVSRSTLVYHHYVAPFFPDVRQQLLERRPIHAPAGEPAIIVSGLD